MVHELRLQDGTILSQSLLVSAKKYQSICNLTRRTFPRVWRSFALRKVLERSQQTKQYDDCASCTKPLTHNSPTGGAVTPNQIEFRV